ncbi:MAG: collagen binding domain-containing protein [Hominisplanchenecus sp.]
MKKGKSKKLTALLLAVSMLGSNSAIAGASGTGAAQVWNNAGTESPDDVLTGTEARITSTYEDGSEQEYTAGGFDNHLEMDLNKKTGKLSRAMSVSIDGTEEPSKEISEITDKEETEEITEAPKETEEAAETETEETETETSVEEESEVELESETSSKEESEMISLTVFKDKVIESEKYMELDADELGGEDVEDPEGGEKLELQGVKAQARLSAKELELIPTDYTTDIRKSSDPSPASNITEFNGMPIYRVYSGSVLPSKYTARIVPQGKTSQTAGYTSVSHGPAPHNDAYLVTTGGRTFEAIYPNAVQVGMPGTANYATYNMKATITGYRISAPYLANEKKGTPYIGFSGNGGVYCYGIEYIDVRYDFYSSNGTPVSISGIYSHQDIDRYQGIVFRTNIEAMVLNSSKMASHLKLTTTKNGKTYIYYPEPEATQNEITKAINVLFTGSHTFERYTFVKPRDAKNPFPYGNMQIDTGDIKSDYVPPTFSINKFVNKSTTSKSCESSNQNQYVGNAAGNTKFAYWLKINNTTPLTANSMYLSSLSIKDTLPKWVTASKTDVTVYSGNTEMTGRFTIDVTGENVSVTANPSWLGNTDFYNVGGLGGTGRVYYVRIICTIKGASTFYSSGEPPVAADQRYYQIKNTASLSTNAQSTVSASVDAYLARSVMTDVPGSITKRVSNDSMLYSTEGDSSNNLNKRYGTDVLGKEYYYKLNITVPAKPDAYARGYQSFYIEDEYPSWTQNITSSDVKVYSSSSTSTPVTYFTFSSGKSSSGKRYFRLTADVNNSALYGKTYAVIITVRVMEESDFKTASKPPIDSSGNYYWTNSAKSVVNYYKSRTDTSATVSEKTTGNVTTYVKITETEVADIELSAETYCSGNIVTEKVIYAFGTLGYNIRIKVPEKGSSGYNSLKVSFKIPKYLEASLITYNFGGVDNITNDIIQDVNKWYGYDSNGNAITFQDGRNYKSISASPDYITYDSSTATVTINVPGSLLNNDEFYGKEYRISVLTKLTSKEKILLKNPPVEDSYAYWDATAAVTTNTGSVTKTKTSNKARMKIPLNLPDVPQISKSIIYSGREDTINNVNGVGTAYTYRIKIPRSTRGDVPFTDVCIKDVLPKEVTTTLTQASRIMLLAVSSSGSGTSYSTADVRSVWTMPTGETQLLITPDSYFISSGIYSTAYSYFYIDIPVMVRNLSDWTKTAMSGNSYIWENTAELTTDFGSSTSNKVTTYMNKTSLDPAPIRLEKNVVANSEYSNWKLSQKNITVDSSYSTASYTNTSGATETGKSFSYHIIFSPGASDSTTIPTHGYVITDEVPTWAQITSVQCHGFGSESDSYNYYDYDLSATIDSTKNTVTVRQATSADITGRYYVIVVNCVVRNSDFLSVGEPASDAVNYYWDNRAKLSYKTLDAVGNREMTSNAARVNVPKENFETAVSLKKYIGTNESTTSNTTDHSGTFAYKIKVSVGNRTDTAGFTRKYLDKLVVSDTIPAPLTVTSVSVSNSTYLSATRTVDSSSGTTDITVSDKSGAVTNSNFYGKDYIITINVKVKDDFGRITPEIESTNYIWKNIASVEAKGISIYSNEVVTRMPIKSNVTLRKISAEAFTDRDQTPPDTSGEDNWEDSGAEDIVIPGVRFRVWCSALGYDQTFTTDDLGEIRMTKLQSGTYYYQELSTVGGYLLDSKQRSFTLNGLTLTSNNSDMEVTGNTGNKYITVKNTPTQIAIFKRAEDTNEMLAGARMVLKDSLGNIVEPQYPTEDDGSFITSATEPMRFSRLPAGIYTIEELEAPDGYAVTDPVTITVANTASVQTYTVVDPVAETTVTVGVVIQREQTVMEHGSPLFTLELTGTDQRGAGHTYHGMVEFDESAVNSGESPILSYVFKNVQRGTYQLNWKCPVGYYVKYVGNMSSNVTSTIKTVPVFGSTLPVITIDNTRKGNVAGADDYASTVTLTFYKQTYDDYRHSSSAVNKITIQ